MNVLVLVVILAFGLGLVIGFQRGLIKSVVGVSATLVTLLITFFFAPIVFHYVTEYTDIDEKLETVFYEKIKGSVADEIRQRLQDTKEFSSKEELLKESNAETERIMSENPDRNSQMEIIQVQSVPKFLKDKLAANNNDEMYEKLGVQNVYHYVARSVALSVVNVLVTIAFFLIVRLVLLLVTLIINSMLDAVPALSFANHVAGMLLGGAAAVLFIWMAMVAYSLVDGEAYEIMLGQNQFLQIFDTYNLIAKMIAKMGV